MRKTFIGALTLGLALAGAAHAAENDCVIAKDSTSEVGKACKEGGLKKAKAVMKAQTKTAKAGGMKVDCDSCHKNEKDWTLTDNGKEDFKKMQAIIAKAGK
jgi:hypothetical protein